MIVAIIPAQGTSRRLSGKNMRIVAGKPLLLWAIEAAQKSEKIEKVIVTTDDEKIADYAKSKNALVILRDKNLCGETPVIEVYKDAVRKSGLDNITYVVAIQPDHPDRKADIDNLLSIAIEKDIRDFITIDSFGIRNGSVHIMKATDMLENRISYLSGAFVDNCTNIHTLAELNRADACLRRRMYPLKIDTFKLLKNGPTFIIIGLEVNENLSLENIKIVIDIVNESGANAIFLERLLDHFDIEACRQIFDYCKINHIAFIAIALNTKQVEVFKDLGADSYLCGINLILKNDFVKHVASSGRPIIIETSGSTNDEIRMAVDKVLMQGAQDIILLNNFASDIVSGKVDIEKVSTLKLGFSETLSGVITSNLIDGNSIETMIAAAFKVNVIAIPIMLKDFFKNKTQKNKVKSALIENLLNIRLIEKAVSPNNKD